MFSPHSASTTRFFCLPSPLHYDHHVLFLVCCCLMGITVWGWFPYILVFYIFQNLASGVRCAYLCGHFFFSLVGFYLLRCCTSCFMYQWTLSVILFLDVGWFPVSFLSKGLGRSVYVNVLITMLCDLSRVLRVDLLKLWMKVLRGSSSDCRHPKIGWAFVVYHLCWINVQRTLLRTCWNHGCSLLVSLYTIIVQLLIGWLGWRCTNTFHLSNKKPSSTYSFRCDHRDLPSYHPLFLVYSLWLVTGTHVYSLPEVTFLILNPACY